MYKFPDSDPLRTKKELLLKKKLERLKLKNEKQKCSVKKLMKETIIAMIT